MRVGIVGYEMEGQRSGVGRYLEGLLQGTAELGDAASGWSFELFFKGDPFDHPLWSNDLHRDASRSARGFDGAAFSAVFDRRPRARPILWEQARLPKLLRRRALDLVFSPGYSVPRARCPRVVTLHDLSFEHLPEEFDTKERLRRRWLARRAARACRRVLVDTQSMIEDVHSTYGVAKERLAVVPLAVDMERFRSPASTDIEAALDPLGARRPYVLMLASFLPRRRLELVLGAFAELAVDRPELQLLLAGRDRLPGHDGLRRAVDASPIACRVRRLDYVPEASVPALYAGAELTFYLSDYEGYGLPPLESLATGTPAVVSPGQGLDDLWPDYPFRVDISGSDPSGSAVVERVSKTCRRALDLTDPAAFRSEACRRLGAVDWRHCAQLWLRQLELAAS